MIEIRPMDEGYVHIQCMHHGPIDPLLPPRPEIEWIDAPDLAPHPWSDETIVELAETYRRISEGWTGDPAREFMREMMQRYGTCAMLAWEGGKVVGHLRFYPLVIAQLLVRADPEKQHLVRWAGAMSFGADPVTLWVQCVMTCVPFVGSEETVRGGRHFPSMDKAGARKGRGLKLVRGLISWAREHGWKRIVKQTNADLDCMYGMSGGAGKAFWEKAGFKVVGTHFEEYPNDDDWKATVESQAKAKGMSMREAWTLYHMACDL